MRQSPWPLSPMHYSRKASSPALLILSIVILSCYCLVVHGVVDSSDFNWLNPPATGKPFNAPEYSDGQSHITAASGPIMPGWRDSVTGICRNIVHNTTTVKLNLRI